MKEDETVVFDAINVEYDYVSYDYKENTDFLPEWMNDCNKRFGKAFFTHVPDTGDQYVILATPEGALTPAEAQEVWDMRRECNNCDERAQCNCGCWLVCPGCDEHRIEGWFKRPLIKPVVKMVKGLDELIRATGGYQDKEFEEKIQQTLKKWG